MTLKYSLKDLTLYFLKLGYAGFGGPVALVGYMHKARCHHGRFYWIFGQWLLGGVSGGVGYFFALLSVHDFTRPLFSENR